MLVLPTLSFAQPAVLKGIALQDHHQQTVRAASLQGKVVLINFVFTGCSSICPSQVVELAQLHAALDKALPRQQRSQVQFLSISVDPLSDTPQALATFARRMGADLPAWRFATGKPELLHRLFDRMRVFEPGATEPADHRSSLYLFGPSGQLLQRFRGVPVDVPRLQDEISRVVLAAAAPGAQ